MEYGKPMQLVSNRASGLSSGRQFFHANVRFPLLVESAKGAGSMCHDEIEARMGDNRFLRNEG
jgi:hypothetical protein